MRIVVVGAGAVGGAVGGRLHQSGHEVLLVARGAHFEAICARGLVVRDPRGEETVSVPAVERTGDIDWRLDDVVLLATKSQATSSVLEGLAAVAPRVLPLVCLQNGVDNERQALRRFERVYGICVMCPATHLEPGVVAVHSWPLAGLLDVGRYPMGVDDITAALASAFERSSFESIERPDIMRWKYTKLLMNLANVVEALCKPSEAASQLVRLVRREGAAALAAAGIDVASREEDARRRGDKLRLDPVAGVVRGGSTWQSLARGQGGAETDYLNGEVVLLGRLHGVATPVNAALQRAMHQALAEGWPPQILEASRVMEEFA